MATALNLYETLLRLLEYAELDANFKNLRTTADAAAPASNPSISGLLTLLGGQIKFPANQVASADPNTLDDYEEGTFTPIVADAISGGNVGTLGASAGASIKTGNVVNFSMSLINITTTGMTAGNAVIVRGLPFIAKNLTNLYQPVTVLFSSLTTTAGSLQGLVNPNTGAITISNGNITGVLDNLLVSDITSGSSDLYIAGSYLV